MEEWKDVVGYEGKYQVTATGRIRTLNFKGTGIAQELFPIKNKRKNKLKREQLR